MSDCPCCNEYTNEQEAIVSQIEGTDFINADASTLSTVASHFVDTLSGMHRRPLLNDEEREAMDHNRAFAKRLIMAIHNSLGTKIRARQAELQEQAEQKEEALSEEEFKVYMTETKAEWDQFQFDHHVAQSNAYSAIVSAIPQNEVMEFIQINAELFHMSEMNSIKERAMGGLLGSLLGGLGDEEEQKEEVLH